MAQDTNSKNNVTNTTKTNGSNAKPTISALGTITGIAGTVYGIAKPVIDKARPVIENKVDNIEDVVKCSKPYIKAEKTAREIETKIDRARNGYSTIDVWNLGDYLVDREEELLDMLSEQRYENVELEWFNKLKSNADYLREYKKKIELIDGMHMIKGANHDAMLAKQQTLSTEISTEFLAHWIEIGDTLYTRKFVIPEMYTDSIGNKMFDMVLKMRSKTGASEAALKETLQKDELEIISNMLYDLARTSHGSPENYIGSKYELLERDEKWLDSRAGIAFIMYGNKNIIESERESNGDMKKNREIGDYAAWVEDIAYASNIMRDWGEWLANNENSETYSLIDETMSEAEAIMLAEFKRCWKWIGKNITTLWD